MNLIKAPEPIPDDVPRPWIFLAGSIEMGEAENWQAQIENTLENCTVLNPRRDDWNKDWVQCIENDMFREQVEWELDGLDNADLIVMYFDPSTKSPITLLELGLQAHRKSQNLTHLVVCCPEGFWRKGNVDIVCKRNNIKQVENLRQLIFYLGFYLAEWRK
jgi:hypothetical protein